MAEASWLADPTGVHELRYWNGSSWTEHVSDQGTTRQDPLTTELPPPVAAFPPPPGPPPTGILTEEEFAAQKAKLLD